MDNFNIHDWQIKKNRESINEVSAIEKHANTIVDTVEEMQELLKWIKEALNYDDELSFVRKQTETNVDHIGHELNVLHEELKGLRLPRK